MRVLPCGKFFTARNSLLHSSETRISVTNTHLKIRMPPGQNMDDWWTVLRSGMWKLYFKLSKEGRKRWFKEFLPKLHDAK